MSLFLCKVIVFMFAAWYTVAGKIDDNEVKSWVSAFQQNLNGHINSVLAVKEIESNFEKFNKDLLIAKLNGTEVFSAIYQSVSIRFTELESAVGKIKFALENGSVPTTAPTPPAAGVPPIGGPPMAHPPQALTRCCMGKNLIKYKYNGRFRDEVYEKECFENVDGTLRQVAASSLMDTLKKNFQDYPAITWQYFAGDAGHYIQYPTNDRLCDKTSGNISSPLVQEWFVEKLHMERKNLIILLDNGKSAGKEVVPGKPTTKRELMKDGVQRSLRTLTDNDKVSVVAFPSASQNTETEVLGSCQDGLYVATERNKDSLSNSVGHLAPSSSEPNLHEGLRKAYELLEDEKSNNPGSFRQGSNIILIVLDGESKPTGVEKSLLEMIAREQGKLNHSVQHFIYTLGNSSQIELLAQVADQNNMKLNRSSGVVVQPWPQISVLVNNNTVVGKEGVLDIITDPEQFPSRVSTYFQRLPPQVDKEARVVAPILDSKLGVSMTLAKPVYNTSSGQVLGVAAVDASVAKVFSEIANFDIGENSYAFLFETNNGEVILHPKLRDPGETQEDDSLFPTLDLMEPELSSSQIQALHTATNTMQKFDTKVHDVQYLSVGETSLSRQPLPATMYYQLIGGTQLCVVVVHLQIDGEEAKKQKDQTGTDLHAPYHRIDKLFGSPEGNKPAEVCALDRHFVSFKESVIKLSPSVFQDPENYKYSEESFGTITEINNFLTKQVDTGTGLIREDLKSLIQHTVRSSQYLDTLWTSTAKEVIERFYGTPTGVFRVYPGIPLPNTFDHIKSEWWEKEVSNTATSKKNARYTRSLAYPNRTVYHRGRLSWANQQDVIIVTRTLIDRADYGRLQGVLGMTVTPRFLSSLLVKGAADCYGSDKTCHIVDDKGNIIDSFLEPKQSRHISTVFPWLADKLRKEGKLKVDWCTGFSDGYHKMTFTLDKVDSSDVTNSNQCEQYKLQHIPETNIHLLVLNNRTTLNCDEAAIKPCVCPSSSKDVLPQCQYCYGNLGGACQCECSCDTDFNQCQDTYNFTNANFPIKACYYSQIKTTRRELLPDVPNPFVKHCETPCVALEDLTECSRETNCKVNNETYPTCIWKKDDELNKTRTTTPKAPASPPLFTKSTKQPVAPGTGPPTMGPPSLKPPHTSGPPTVRPPSLRPPQTTGQPTKKPPITKQSGPPPAGKSSPKTSPPGLHTKSTKAPPGSPPGHVTTTGIPATAKSSSIPGLSGSSISSTQHYHKDSNKSDDGGDGLSGGGTAAIVIAVLAEAQVLGSDDDKGGLSGGGIAAIVIAVLAVTLITIFVVIKFYGKKFRRPVDESSKYLQGSSMFDSTVFNRSQDQVTIGAAPTSTIPYQEM